VREKSDSSIILLIDDLRSELDEASQQSVFSELIDIGLQLFIANIEGDIPGALRGKEFKMFHVEHGMIKALKPS
jgi:recombinational DNA repair ATPase RecF